MIGLLPVVFAGLLFILTQKRENLKNNSEIFPEKFLTTIFICFYLYQITLIRNMVEYISCVEIDDVKFLKIDMSVKCDDSSHNIIVINNSFKFI